MVGVTIMHNITTRTELRAR